MGANPRFCVSPGITGGSVRSLAVQGANGGLVKRPGRKVVYVADLKKGARITGSTREKLAADLKKKYEKGASIRSLAESTGRSYGFVHRVLTESGVQLRGRGGATRGKKS